MGPLPKDYSIIDHRLLIVFIEHNGILLRDKEKIIKREREKKKKELPEFQDLQLLVWK